MNVTPSSRVDARLDPPPPGTIVTHGAVPTVSWGALLAGAIVAIAFGAMLHALGAAIGASSVDAVERDTPSGTTMTIAAASWMALSSALGLLLGGIVAARLAGTWSRKDALLHGMGVWAVSFIIAIALIGTALSGGTVAAIRGVTGAATTVAAAGGAAIASQVDPAAIAEGLQRRLAAPSDLAAMPREDLTAEMADLATRRIANGSWNPDDRARMEQLIAATAGTTPEVARTRLDEAEQALTARMQAAEEQARRAADVAASSGAVLAFWAFATMLLGLGAAVGGAALGARR
jgi:MFS family permease